MDKRQLNEWGRRLDAGLTDDPTLALAGRLRGLRPLAPQPPTEFRGRLKAQLLSTKNAKSTVVGPRLRMVVALSLFIILVVGAIWIFPGAQPVSAGEILQRANTNFIAQAQGDGILYSQFTLLIDRSYQQLTAVGELWQSLETEQFRYQLVDTEGALLYFVQRDGDRIWRSVHDQPVGTTAVESVYLLTAEQYASLISPEESASQRSLPPIFGDLINWIEVDRWLATQSQTCDDLFCLLGLSDSEAWSCDGDSCTLPLLEPELDLPAVMLRATVSGKEQFADGRTVFDLEFRTTHDDALIRTLKFDSRNFDLVEIVAYSSGNEVARMTFLERQVLSTDTAFFRTLPEGLGEMEWGGAVNPPDPTLGGTPLFHPPAGSIVTAIPQLYYSFPQKGTTISGQVEFVFFIRPRLGVRGEADLVVRLCDASPDQGPSFSNCTGLPEVQTRVFKYDGYVRVSFVAQVDENWPAIVTVALGLRYDDGNSLSVLQPDYFWYVAPQSPRYR